MAAGDGFKQVPFGFDKNEVNTYISDLRKKMSALEADMKKNDEKTKAAEKLAEEADSRIKAAQAEADRKVGEVSAQLEEEKEVTSRQAIEIRSLKDRVDAEKKKMTDMLKSGKGVSAEATRTFNEVLEKANDEAAEIIEKAKKKAAEIVAEAAAKQNEMNGRTSAFLDQLRAQLETMNEGYNAVNASAAELLGTAPAEAVTLPAPEPAAKPVYTAPAFEEEEPAETPDLSVFDQVNEEPEEELQPQPAAEPEQPAAEPEDEPVSEPVTLPLTVEDGAPAVDVGAPAVFEEEWGGNEMADAVAAAEQKMAEENKEDIPLMNPDASNPFGGDLFTNNDQEDMTGFDMDKPEDTVDTVAPLDVSDHAEASFDNDFTTDLLAQTMNSSSLGNDADEDLLAAVKAAEEAAAIKPNNVSDFSMDDEPEDSGMSEEDALMKALRDAEAALQSVSDSGSSTEETAAEEPAADDPWADLQKQLEAMESANGADSAISYDEPEKQKEPAEENPATPPSADDSSIWDFGGSSDSSDDDMSSDFGGFGGF